MKPHSPKSVGKRAQRKTPNATQPKPPGGAAPSGRLSTAKIVIAALAVASLFGGLGFAFQTFYGGWWGGSASHASPASFVGSETCAGCHRPEAELWRSSQHNLAMQHASDKTVLGDFNDASFDYYGVQSRFFRKDGKFLVETDGPDGTLGTYQIKYTFGVDPLQQYLIEFSDGRLQALSIAWDSRSKEQGGQRWFHLYPDEQIKHDDILHWTKLNQNWNFMCAECHSTGVQKNYDAKNDRFATIWAEISVGCETCHGQGSRHVAWAQRAQSWWPFGKDKSEDQNKGLLVHFDERHDIIWRPDARTGNAQRNYTPAILRKEVETCGLCHARRGQFSEEWIPGRWLSDTHVVSSLARGLYYPDGQMRDEVYNYGSFKQSKMFAAGVTCSDCHEPHGAKLRAPGDGVCMQCHSPDKYAAATHHHHGSASTAPSCASCHMPTGTYMVIDRRHDHGFRVPRPDLSVKLGTPNTCNACHADKAADWAAAAIESWHGSDRKGWQTYAQAFHAGWTDQIDAAALLALVAGGNVPRFARASALAELAPYVSPANINLARGALSDPDPMVRIGALDMLGNLPPAQIWQLVSPLLSDSSRGVRIRAVALLAAVPTAGQPPADRERFEHAATEFIAAQRLNADRPEARTTLGSFFARRGRSNDAEVEYKAALRLNPQFAAAAVNLADLYRQLGRDSEGESTLRGTIAASPQDAALHHALGLVLTRLKRTDEALDELRHAAELEPERARYAYVYAVALNSAGRAPQAVAFLKEILVRHPNNRDTLLALISFTRDAGEIATALEYAEQLAKAFPGDPSVTALVEDLRRRFAK